MMSTRFLPMSWTSPFTVASTIRPRPPWSLFSMCGSRCATADFIVSALCKTKGNCMSPDANRSPTSRMPSRRRLFTMSRGAIPSAIAWSRSVVQFEIVQRAGDRARRRNSFIESEQHRERIIFFMAPVIDEVEADPTGLFIDAVQRENFRRVHDGGVETGPGRFMKKHAVEHLARRRIETEGDVGEAEDRPHTGQFRLDPFNRLKRFDAVAPRLDHAGRKRERQRVDEDVVRVKSVTIDRQVGYCLGRADLPLGGTSLTFFVNARGDDGASELRRQREEAVEPCALAIALFEVDRVQQCLTPEPSERLSSDLRLGRVDHDGHR